MRNVEGVWGGVALAACRLLLCVCTVAIALLLAPAASAQEASAQEASTQSPPASAIMQPAPPSAAQRVALMAGAGILIVNGAAEVVVGALDGEEAANAGEGFPLANAALMWAGATSIVTGIVFFVVADAMAPPERRSTTARARPRVSRIGFEF